MKRCQSEADAIENTATLKFCALISMEATVIPIPTFFYLKPAYKLKFPHYIANNISHPNCKKHKLYAFIIFMWAMTAWEFHILKRKKNSKNDRPKMLLTRNCQITIISITFSCLSFTARSISSSFFSMSRRSKAYIRNNIRSVLKYYECKYCNLTNRNPLNKAYVKFLVVTD